MLVFLNATHTDSVYFEESINGSMYHATRAIFQYPTKRLIVKSLEVSKPRDLYINYSFSVKCARYISSTAADVPVKFQSDGII